jgi:hypothetical protein
VVHGISGTGRTTDTEGITGVDQQGLEGEELEVGTNIEPRGDEDVLGDDARVPASLQRGCNLFDELLL